jgi:hypothetical protein
MKSSGCRVDLGDANAWYRTEPKPAMEGVVMNVYGQLDLTLTLTLNLSLSCSPPFP